MKFTVFDNEEKPSPGYRDKLEWKDWKDDVEEALEDIARCIESAQDPKPQELLVVAATWSRGYSTQENWEHKVVHKL